LCSGFIQNQHHGTSTPSDKYFAHTRSISLLSYTQTSVGRSSVGQTSAGQNSVGRTSAGRTSAGRTSAGRTSEATLGEVNLSGADLIKAADYIKSRWKLDLLRRTIDDAFNDFDLVVLPTRRRTPRTVTAAIKLEESEKIRNTELENTGQFNIYGIPAISVPCGFSTGGLPIGLMIAGPRFAEGKVLALAAALRKDCLAVTYAGVNFGHGGPCAGPDRR
jgi:aspartyl-tRNA(Asn)/glutamyl-tRNA(Gln) amidotransferase subunit A